MRSRNLSIGWMAILAFFLVAYSTTKTASAQETVLHSFNGNDGNEPIGGLVFDGSGNLYGATFDGGTLGDGVVYKLSPGASGWTDTVLFSFNGAGGFDPTSSLVFDTSGNLYGTTFFGGALGVGTAFEITPISGGWTMMGVHDFSPFGDDGTYPHSGVIFDGSGNLYGVTPGGGDYKDGTVYELTPNPSGGWTEKILHSFNGQDGSSPDSRPIFDASGNLYGATNFGGGTSSACQFGCGVIFELTPAADGTWTEKTVHNFTKNSQDGNAPATGLMIDAAGNLYGATSGGAAYNWGSVFELTPLAGGGWKETVLHNFTSNGIDGNNPTGPLVRDAAGNLYGTTSNGGAYGDGTVFKLTPTAHGAWKETILHSFNPNGTDISTPNAGVVLDGSGNLYGTAEGGGTYGYGGVFEITP
jgi:uncharacterized repeat protein (TIGR03803 family)